MERALRQTGPVRERQEAAEALSFVIDPIATEFLVRVAEARLGNEQMALKGLVRIGGQDGRQALARLVHHPDQNLAQAATRALATGRGCAGSWRLVRDRARNVTA